MSTENSENQHVKDSFLIRPYRESDKKFILSSWLHRNLYAFPYWHWIYKLIPYYIYMSKYGQVIESILSKNNIEIKVCCLESDQDVIIGYSVVEQPGIFHFIYIKETWRNQGLFSLLVSKQQLKDMKIITHITDTVFKKIPKHVIFNPFDI